MNNKKALPDLMVNGFHRLDDHLLERNAPKLSLMSGFHDKDPQSQVRYMLRLASTMNHAAYLISKERDKLGEVLVLKDSQVKELSARLGANNEMIQSEVTKMNELKQGFHAEVRRLNARIRELERGDND